MKIVGLTGGIGSGKSTVLNEFKDLGIKTYSADKAAKTLINTDRALIDSIKKVFGNNIYQKNKIDTKQLSKIVFQDSDKLKVLNSIIHPAVSNDFDSYAKKVHSMVKEVGISCEVDLKNQNLNYKIREHSLLKVPVLIICGKKEVDSNTVTIRRLDSNKQENMDLKIFIKNFSALNKTPSN